MHLCQRQRKHKTLKLAELITALLLGDVVSVDDGGGPQQLLEFLGFESLWETLQRHQQQLQLLWSAEG